MISFSAEQNSTMPAHLSIIQHLLFHLFKLAGNKNHFSSQRRAREHAERSESVCSALTIHRSFFTLAKKTMILDLHLLNWSYGEETQLHRNDISRKPDFTKKDGGGGLKLSFVASCIDGE